MAHDSAATSARLLLEQMGPLERAHCKFLQTKCCWQSVRCFWSIYTEATVASESPVTALEGLQTPPERD